MDHGAAQGNTVTASIFELWAHLYPEIMPWRTGKCWRCGLSYRKGDGCSAARHKFCIPATIYNAEEVQL